MTDDNQTDIFALALVPPPPVELLDRCAHGCSYVKPPGLAPARCTRCNNTFQRRP